MPTNEICTICELEPEDLLVLSCSHDLCISCAVEIFTLNGATNPFTCEICQAETELDPETLHHFQQSTEKPVTKIESKSKKMPKIPKASSSSRINDSQGNFCRLHNETSLYFCFDCNMSDICSECILTQKHANHKVTTLKKAISNLSQKVEQEIKCCEGIKVELEEQKKAYLLAKREMKEVFNAKKEEVKEFFEELARISSEKYGELSSIIEEECLKCDQVFDACLSEISEKQRVLNESLKIQKRSIKAEHGLTDIFLNIGDNKGIYYPNLPKELPNCSFELHNTEEICIEISRLLENVMSKSKSDDIINYSVIGGDYHEESRSALKESHRISTNNIKGSNRMSNSRKLDMSRSIENATYIINRLQERSKLT